MEIQITNNTCIITPLTPIIDKRETERLEKELKQYSNISVGLDLSYVEDCTIDFIEGIKSWKTSLFNIQSNIFSLLIIMNIDKLVNLYTTEEDFINNKRRLLNRKFSLV